MNRFFFSLAPREQGKALLNSGAAGFVLSRGSLSLLHQAWRAGEGGGRADSLGGSVDHSGGHSDGEGEERGPPTECVAKSNYERGNPGGCTGGSISMRSFFARSTVCDKATRCAYRTHVASTNLSWIGLFQPEHRSAYGAAKTCSHHSMASPKLLNLLETKPGWCPKPPGRQA